MAQITNFACFLLTHFVSLQKNSIKFYYGKLRFIYR